MKGKYMENPDYIINCYKKGKLVKDIEIQMDEKIFKHQIKEGFLNYLDVNSGEVETINLNQFDYYEIKDLRTKEKEICHKCHKYPAEYNQTYCEFCLGISKLEEKKIPEKLELYEETQNIIRENNYKLVYHDIHKCIVSLECKYNQLIDYLKSKGE